MTSKLLYALIFFVPLAAGSGASEPPKNTPAAIRLSELLDFDTSACDGNCELSGCSQGQHQNFLRIGEGNDTGEYHSQCQAGSCRGEPHNHDGCFAAGGLTPEELEEMIDLIPQLSVGELVAMDTRETNLLVNHRRQAAQVLGCAGMVLASVELTPSQKT